MPIRTRATTLVTAVAAVVLVTTGSCARRVAPQASAPEVPSPGTPTTASCPQTLDLGLWPGRQTRTGPFLPGRPIEALLCGYPLHTEENGIAQFVGPARSAADPVAVAAYFNAIPDRPARDGGTCLDTAAYGYALVFGYADRPVAVVHLGCGAEQSGAVRYDYDIRAVYAFWGLPKTGLAG